MKELLLKSTSSNGKVRLVLFQSRFNVGGVSSLNLSIVPFLEKKGFEVFMIGGELDQGEIEVDYGEYGRDQRPIIIKGMSRDIRLWNDFISIIKVFRALKAIRPEIVHTHTSKAGVVGRVAALLAGTKVNIYSFHGHRFIGYFSKWKSKLFVLIERILARWTDRIIVPTTNLRDELVLDYEIAAQEKFRIIPYGLDVGRFAKSEQSRGALRHDLGVPSDTLLIGSVGRLVGVKNYILFLNAIADLKEHVGVDFAKVRFVIAGDGIQRLELESLSKQLGISNDVIFLGALKDLAPLYAALDVFIITSITEGVPITLLEAMAAGKAIISTGVGGIPEIAKDSGVLLIQSNDRKALVGTMKSLIRDKLRREECGRRSLEKARRDFGIEHIANNYADLYLDELRKKQPSRVSPILDPSRS